MPIEDYWKGEGIDVEKVWADFDAGVDFVERVRDVELHLLRLVFVGHQSNLPLFDHEAIYKTVKGTFHDVKAECFPRRRYEDLVPIFLYRVDRGAGVLEFLGQFDPVLTWVIALGAAANWYRSAVAKDQDLDQTKPNSSSSATTFPPRTMLTRGSI